MAFYFRFVGLMAAALVVSAVWCIAVLLLLVTVSEAVGVVVLALGVTFGVPALAMGLSEPVERWLH